jgi:hypothetical protein
MGAAIGVAYVLIFVCNQRSGPNVTAMVQPAMPICTTLLSAALGLEKVSVGKAVGLAVATVGTATTLRVLEIEQGASLLDAVLLLTQANAYAVYVVLLTLALKSLDAQLRADLLKKKKEKEKETELVRERSDDVRSSVASSKKVAAPPGPMRFLFAATVVAEVGVAAIAAEDLVENIEWASLPPVAWGAPRRVGPSRGVGGDGVRRVSRQPRQVSRATPQNERGRRRVCVGRRLGDASPGQAHVRRPHRRRGGAGAGGKQRGVATELDGTSARRERVRARGGGAR